MPLEDQPDGTEDSVEGLIQEKPSEDLEVFIPQESVVYISEESEVYTSEVSVVYHFDESAVYRPSSENGQVDPWALITPNYAPNPDPNAEVSIDLLDFVPLERHDSPALWDTYNAAPPGRFYHVLLGVDPNGEVNLFPPALPPLGQDPPEVVLLVEQADNLVGFFDNEFDNVSLVLYQFGRGDCIYSPLLLNPDDPQPGTSQSADSPGLPEPTPMTATMVRRQRRRACSHFNSPDVVDLSMANTLADALQDLGVTVQRNNDREQYHSLFHMFDEFRFPFPSSGLEPDHLSSDFLNWSHIVVPPARQLTTPPVVSPANVASQLHEEFGSRIELVMYRLLPTENWMEKIIPIRPRKTGPLTTPVVTFYVPIEEMAWALAFLIMSMVLIFKLLFLFVLNYIVFYRY